MDKEEIKGQAEKAKGFGEAKDKVKRAADELKK